jgi:ATP-dependent DNA ligase
MQLPVNPPVLPMLAKRVAALPDGADWIFEPKWDGFRALVFRDGDEIFCRAATRSRSTAISPSCGHTSSRSSRSAARSTASS